MYALSMILSDICVIGKLPDTMTLNRIFNISHEALKIAGENQEFDLATSGTTLSLLFLHHEERIVVTAWVGDSACVLVDNTQPEGSRLQSMTCPHDPRDLDERKRIYQAGGSIAHQPGVAPMVGSPGGVELTLTRSLGDVTMHSFGVSHTPGIKKFRIAEEGTAGAQVLLCCSDGVWEYVQQEEAMKVVEKAGRANVAKATETLVAMARERWQEDDEETDDITAIVLWP